MWKLCCFVKATLSVSVFQALYLQQAEVNREKVSPMHQSSIDGVEDMSTLAELHEAAIMHNLHQRYQKGNIYVRILETRDCTKVLETVSGLLLYLTLLLFRFVLSLYKQLKHLRYINLNHSEVPYHVIDKPYDIYSAFFCLLNKSLLTC